MADAEFESLGQLLAALPAAERAQRYREIARDAFQRSETAQDETMRAGYLSLASGWQVLALEIEHSMAFSTRLPDSEPDPDCDFTSSL